MENDKTETALKAEITDSRSGGATAPGPFIPPGYSNSVGHRALPGESVGVVVRAVRGFGWSRKVMLTIG